MMKDSVKLTISQWDQIYGDMQEIAGFMILLSESNSNKDSFLACQFHLNKTVLL